jgi:hypothetical protein
MVAIVGPSGSGKSTLMHILGLLHGPDLNHGPRPQLSFGGRDIVELGEGERTRIRAREMGFVFQDFNLVPTLPPSTTWLADRQVPGGGPEGALERRAVGLAGGPAPAGVSGRAAAGRPGPGPRQQAPPHPGRRADRQPRLGALDRDPRPAPALEPGRGPDDRARDPRCRSGRRL